MKRGVLTAIALGLILIFQSFALMPFNSTNDAVQLSWAISGELKEFAEKVKTLVEGATVIVIDGSGKMLFGKMTDNNGELKLVLPNGGYKITIQANNYKKLTESIQIKGDMQKTFELVRTNQ